MQIRDMCLAEVPNSIRFCVHAWYLTGLLRRRRLLPRFYHTESAARFFNLFIRCLQMHSARFHFAQFSFSPRHSFPYYRIRWFSTLKLVFLTIHYMHNVVLGLVEWFNVFKEQLFRVDRNGDELRSRGHRIHERLIFLIIGSSLFPRKLFF